MGIRYENLCYFDGLIIDILHTLWYVLVGIHWGGGGGGVLSEKYVLQS